MLILGRLLYDNITGCPSADQYFVPITLKLIHCGTKKTKKKKTTKNKTKKKKTLRILKTSVSLPVYIHLSVTF